MAATTTVGREAARRVRYFVRGARRLAITSASLADLLGLAEDKCQAALESMAARGMLRKDASGPGAPLYCKE